MKFLALVIIIFSCQVSIGLIAQNSNLPSKVAQAFNKKYVSAENIQWDKTDSSFEATFNRGDAYYLAIYKPNGLWVETTKTIYENKLSAIHKKNIYAKYPKGSIFNIIYFENNKNSNYYLITVELSNLSYILKMNDIGDILKVDTIQNSRSY